MPVANRFQHQVYRATTPISPHHLVNPQSYPRVGSEEFLRRMVAVGNAYRFSSVAIIYLVHGTFVGNDALGILADLGRLYPAAGSMMRSILKQMIDSLTSEVGNYTGGYAKTFEDAINSQGDTFIPVRRFHWSSQNNHIGRADAAVRLIEEIAALELERGQRVLLWGHSHAGNVFALITNLLASDRDTRDKFFDAARVFYRWPILGCIDIPIWRRARTRLNTQPEALNNTPLDFATFGTPIRYGWDSAGYSKLIHFVNHRPATGLPNYRAPFPPTLDRVLAATDGDYIQQLGIAGTNVMPSPLTWRSWLADSRLHRLLQPSSAQPDLIERLQAGTRVPEEGTTLLVNYGPVEGNIGQHVAGHAIYTQQKWLLFHAEQVAQRLYSAK